MIHTLDDRAKRVIVMARQRAEGLRSHVIGAEHLLLGLLAVREGLAARAVAGLAGSGTESLVTGSLMPGLSPSPSHLPFSATCEQAMTRAAQQALSLGDNHVGTEHLLLALLLDTGNPAVAVLARLGVDYDTVKAELARLRAEGDQPS